MERASNDRVSDLKEKYFSNERNTRSEVLYRQNVMNDDPDSLRVSGIYHVGAARKRQVLREIKNERARRVSIEHEKNNTSSSNRSSILHESTLQSYESLDVEHSLRPPVLKPRNNFDYLKEMILTKYLNLLMLLIPFAIASNHLRWSSGAIFWLNFFAMVPLASLLGDFTEELAAHTNQLVGGLINASFGNAVEVVVAVQALLADEIRVVQASMIGSIFSNLLLVLGSCFFFGGIRHKEQTFNSAVMTASMGLLSLSSIAFVLPTPFADYYDVQDTEVLLISRIAAIFLIFMYCQLLGFQLFTHTYLFEDEEEEEPQLDFGTAVWGLVILTILLSILSEYLVGSIDGFCESTGVSRTFVGLIILPVVGNAVEHITAINVAVKNKMDLAMGVAVGSCTQISLFVAPLTVIVGWALDKPMTLNFPVFETTLFILSIVTVSIISSYPRTNWLEGSLLVTTYVLIGVGFWFEKVEDYSYTHNSEL